MTESEGIDFCLNCSQFAARVILFIHLVEGLSFRQKEYVLNITVLFFKFFIGPDMLSMSLFV